MKNLCTILKNYEIMFNYLANHDPRGAHSSSSLICGRPSVVGPLHINLTWHLLFLLSLPPCVMETMLLGCSPKQRYSGQDRRRRSFSLSHTLSEQKQLPTTGCGHLIVSQKLARYENKRRGENETFVYLSTADGGENAFLSSLISLLPTLWEEVSRCFPSLPKIETLAWKEEEEEEDGGICQGLLGRNASSSPFFFFLLLLRISDFMIRIFSFF